MADKRRAPHWRPRTGSKAIVPLGATSRAIGRASSLSGPSRILASTRSNGAQAPDRRSARPAAWITVAAVPARLSLVLARAALTARISLSASQRYLRSARAAAIASTPEPVPTSSTRMGAARRLAIRSMARRQPWVVPWCPVPKASAASISMPMRLAVRRLRSWAPCTTSTSRNHRREPARLAATQSVAATVSRTRCVGAVGAATSTTRALIAVRFEVDRGSRGNHPLSVPSFRRGDDDAGCRRSFPGRRRSSARGSRRPQTVPGRTRRPWARSYPRWSQGSARERHAVARRDLSTPDPRSCPRRCASRCQQRVPVPEASPSG